MSKVSPHFCSKFCFFILVVFHSRIQALNGDDGHVKNLKTRQEKKSNKL